MFGRDLAGPGRGVYGKAMGGGSGVYGENPDASGWAGNFAGNVRVTRNEHFGATTRQMLNLYQDTYGIGVSLPAGSSSRTCQHSFVESPDMMNVYNGNIVTRRLGARPP